MAKKKTTRKTTKKKSTKKSSQIREDPASPKKSKKSTKKKTTRKKSTKKSSSKISKKSTKPVQSEKPVENEDTEERERIESYKHAGEIAKKIKTFIKPKIKTGARLLDLINETEDKIIELGGKPGFPVNISINHVAAHYTSPPDDNSVIQEGDVVKFDFGVHIDGYSVDCAFTISFNDDPSLKDIRKASEEAVKKAISKIKPGTMTNDLGAEIEKTVKSFGFKPIINLTGHKLEQWDIHSGKSIPCTETPTGEKIEEGEVYAVEVFASNGEGMVHAQNNAYIYSLNLAVKRIPLRAKSAKRILGYVSKEWKTLPFSKLQIFRQFPKASFGLIELIRSGKLTEYNVLSERKGFYVSQNEETVLVTEKGCEILT
jgi:methionyl aminopeptidase